VLAFSNVFHFFAHKLASLSAGRLAFALVLARAFNCFFFWHNKKVSPFERSLDVNKKAAGVTSRRLLVPREQAVLSSALLTAALVATTLFAATLFFLLAPLTFAFVSIAILLTALSRRVGFIRLIWILLCVHDPFLYVEFMFRSFALRESTFLPKIGIGSDLD
jgi:hypothetical protein